jgi:hypothetical protein
MNDYFNAYKINDETAFKGFGKIVHNLQPTRGYVTLPFNNMSNQSLELALPGTIHTGINDIHSIYGHESNYNGKSYDNSTSYIAIKRSKDGTSLQIFEQNSYTSNSIKSLKSLKPEDFRDGVIPFNIVIHIQAKGGDG